ncbi:hypothetical protein [Leuconostoc carnosum]|uniref:hypothetical protein n=1 Tax=Leuconostoc carnosum TaxID=1252 RepID=UPI00345DE1BB
MNKKLPLIVLTVAGAFTLAQASLGQQQVSAATKNYTVTVKYVGSDKKTLKTQKVKLASGKTYTPQRYTFKNYTSPKSIAKVKVNGNKTVTVKYNHVVAKQVKKSSQAKVNLKFNFKGSDGRNFGSKTVQVPKGKSYTYVAPKAKELAKNNNKEHKNSPYYEFQITNLSRIHQVGQYTAELTWTIKDTP